MFLLDIHTSKLWTPKSLIIELIFIHKSSRCDNRKEMTFWKYLEGNEGCRLSISGNDLKAVKFSIDFFFELIKLFARRALELYYEELLNIQLFFLQFVVYLTYSQKFWQRSTHSCYNLLGFIFDIENGCWLFRNHKR